MRWPSGVGTLPDRWSGAGVSELMTDEGCPMAPLSTSFRSSPELAAGLLGFGPSAALAEGIRGSFRFAASRSPVLAGPVQSLRRDP